MTTMRFFFCYFFKMKINTINASPVLLLILILLLGLAPLQAQILKDVTGTVKDAGKTVTTPVRDVRDKVKEISDIPRDIENVKGEITRPAEDLKGEVEGLQSDVKNAKSDIEGLGPNLKGSKADQAEKDSLAAVEKANKEKERIRYEAEKARRDSIYKSKLRTGNKIEGNQKEETSAAEVFISDTGRTVLLPPEVIPSKRPTASRTGTRTVSYSRSSPKEEVKTNLTTGGTSGGSAASESSASSESSAPSESKVVVKNNSTSESDVVNKSNVVSGNNAANESRVVVKNIAADESKVVVKSIAANESRVVVKNNSTSGSNVVSKNNVVERSESRIEPKVAPSTSTGEVPMSSSQVKYSNTPARRYLVRSDFDEETLNDLFKAAIWTGPDSVHTARSIEYMLKQYRIDLNEVKRLDPSYDIDNREDRYRKWNCLFFWNTNPVEED